MELSPRHSWDSAKANVPTKCSWQLRISVTLIYRWKAGTNHIWCPLHTHCWIAIYALSWVSLCGTKFRLEIPDLKVIDLPRFFSVKPSSVRLIGIQNGSLSSIDTPIWDKRINLRYGLLWTWPFKVTQSKL